MISTDSVRSALKAPGVNLEALARATGVPSKTLRRWRDGKHSPTLRKAELVMLALANQGTAANAA